MNYIKLTKANLKQDGIYNHIDDVSDLKKQLEHDYNELTSNGIGLYDSETGSVDTIMSMDCGEIYLKEYIDFFLENKYTKVRDE